MPPLVQPKPEPKTLHALELSVEKLTGKTVTALRDLSIEGYRLEIELVHKEPLRFISRFPFIGRGNVLRDRIVERKKVEEQLDAVLY